MTEEKNILVINGQLSEDNKDLDLAIISCSYCSDKDTENQLLQQENETKRLLLTYQLNLQNRLDCKVKSTKNVSFKRIEKSDVRT